MQYVVVGREGRVTKTLDIPLPGMTMLHDMGLTPNWALVLDQPVLVDLDLAFAVFGFTGSVEVPPELRELRGNLFEAAGHHYDLQRAIADAVPDETLRMTPQQVKDAILGGWRKLLATSA